MRMREETEKQRERKATANIFLRLLCSTKIKVLCERRNRKTIDQLRWRLRWTRPSFFTSNRWERRRRSKKWYTTLTYLFNCSDGEDVVIRLFDRRLLNYPRNNPLPSSHSSYLMSEQRRRSRRRHRHFFPNPNLFEDREQMIFFPSLCPSVIKLYLSPSECCWTFFSFFPQCNAMHAFIQRGGEGRTAVRHERSRETDSESKREH